VCCDRGARFRRARQLIRLCTDRIHWKSTVRLAYQKSYGRDSSEKIRIFISHYCPLKPSIQWFEVTFYCMRQRRRFPVTMKNGERDRHVTSRHPSTRHIRSLTSFTVFLVFLKPVSVFFLPPSLLCLTFWVSLLMTAIVAWQESPPSWSPGRHE
jgi:hypothetical protein